MSNKGLFIKIAFASVLTAGYLSLLFGTDGSQEPKFHMMDKVLVTKGFYKGCSGTVVGYSKNTYDVELRCVKGDDIERPDAVLNESELAIVNVEVVK